MKKITLVLFILSTFFSFSQTLNEPANWPNANWIITGDYLTDSDVFEADPTQNMNFAYDDDDADQGHDDNIAAESPIINLTATYNAGETFINVNSGYLYHRIGNELLELQYWDADTSSWMTWGVPLEGTTTEVMDDFCNGSYTSYLSEPLNIASFSANQLSNFRYRISYDDNGTWGWGFCFQSPTLISQIPPPCPNISNLSVTNVGLNSADVYWQAGDVETSWEIVIQNAGLGVPTSNGITTMTNNPYSASGLSSGTNYEVYVRGYCGGTDYSNWIGPINFETITIARVNFFQQSQPMGGYDLTVVDMDGDHLDDIVSASSTNVKILYQQTDGSFNEVNVTTPQADFLPGWSMAAADFDRNGRTDLLYGSVSGVTFMKANSSGTGFTEISGPEDVFSQRSNFVDINNDGNLDAFVCHDVAPNVYYINDGSGNLTFYQGGLGDYPSGGHYGSIWIDYDNDRDMDMFIAKCGGETARRRNIMMTNNGDGTYTENAIDLNLSDPMQTWSSTWADYDNDGDLDVFVGASTGDHKLMRNDGNGVFVDVTEGANVSSAPNGHENVSYDFDNDGYLDIACNGTIMYGKGDMTFEDLDSSQINYKNGSFGDLNNDGFIDTYYSDVIYMNGTTDNNWIKINTIGTDSNIDGIGARVELHTASGIQIREVRSGEGFEYMSTLNTHFGLGTQTEIDSVVVYWPSGIIDTVVDPNINESLEIIEGSTLSLESSIVDNLIMYPNPTKGELNISTIDTLPNAFYTVFDVNGRRVMNAALTNTTIDVSGLQAGNYILRIVSGQSIRSQKFIKQ